MARKSRLGSRGAGMPGGGHDLITRRSKRAAEGLHRLVVMYGTGWWRCAAPAARTASEGGGDVGGVRAADQLSARSSSSIRVSWAAKSLAPP